MNEHFNGNVNNPALLFLLLHLLFVIVILHLSCKSCRKLKMLGNKRCALTQLLEQQRRETALSHPLSVIEFILFSETVVS